MNRRTGSPRATRAAREEREQAVRAAANATDLRAIETVLHEMERCWAMLPSGRVVPARVRAAAERLFSEQRNNAHRRSSRPYVQAADVKALELTDGEVEAGEPGEPGDAVLFHGASLAEAQAAGAPFKLRSMLLAPHVPAEVLRAAEATIPVELTPRADDNVESLTVRAAQAQTLDLTLPLPLPLPLTLTLTLTLILTLPRQRSSTKSRCTTRTRTGRGTHARDSHSSTRARALTSRCATPARCVCR